MTAPKRRWFAFSLRTLFVVVTAICITIGWLAHYANWAQLRNRLRAQPGIRAQEPWIGYWEDSRPIGLRVVGSKPWGRIWLSDSRFTEADRVEFQTAFPEAAIVLVADGPLSASEFASPPRRPTH